MATQSFPKRRRLRARGDFVGIQRRGRRFSRGGIVLVAAKSLLGPRAPARLGLVVSRKVGTAVKRNELKRWVREWFRRATALPRGVDLVVIAKPGAVERGAQVLWTDLGLLVAGVTPERLS